MIKKLLLILFSLTVFTLAKAQEPSCRYAKKQDNVAGFASPSDVASMNNYDVKYYKLDVDVERNSFYIFGNAEIGAKAVKSFSDFVFELHDSLVIDSVLINGVLKSFTRSNGIVTVNMVIAATVNSFVTAKIYYHGFPLQDKASALGIGFTNSVTRQVTWSLSESFVASEWWPCKQVLYDKADSSDVWITTDSANKAGSNGVLVNITNFGNGKKRFEWKNHFPIDYYLISVAVAQYYEYNLYAHPAGIAQPVLIQNYVYDTTVYPALNNVPWMIEMYSTVFGLYPFASEKYGHCMAPINGGMEHQTMTTLGPKSAFTFNVITHELAHQWFGDLVTCGSWADIWLNEGFASYAEYISNERFPTGNPTQWLSQKMSGAKNSWGWVYVHDTLNTSTIFSGSNSYDKGAMILHMLRYEIKNDSIFFLGIRNYLSAFKFSTALGTDFQKVMEQTAGINFGFFFDQWYRGLGYPAFAAQWNQVGNKFLLQLNERTTNTATPIFKTHLDVRLWFSGSDTIVRVWVDSLTKLFVLNVSKPILNIQLDPNEWIINDVDSVKKNSLLTWVEYVKNIANEIIVYPNPSNDKLNLLNATGMTLEIFSIEGKKVFEEIISEPNKTLDISNLSKGIYFIKLSANDFLRTMKFVKE